MASKPTEYFLHPNDFIYHDAINEFLGNFIKNKVIKITVARMPDKQALDLRKFVRRIYQEKYGLLDMNKKTIDEYQNLFHMFVSNDEATKKLAKDILSTCDIGSSGWHLVLCASLQSNYPYETVELKDKMFYFINSVVYCYDKVLKLYVEFKNDPTSKNSVEIWERILWARN